jgi:hypothetical protein
MILGVFISRSAFATVDSLLFTNVVYKQVQEEDSYCFLKTPVMAEIGIPFAVLSEASLKDVMVWNSNGLPTQYVNINEISKSAQIIHKYIHDGYEYDDDFNLTSISYHAELDVTALASANGTSLKGREDTIRQIKMALLAFSRNMNDYYPGIWKLDITINGLPSQRDLIGPKVHAKTSWPYTSKSEIIKSYEKEIIDIHGNCR